VVWPFTKNQGGASLINQADLHKGDVWTLFKLYRRK